MANHTDNSTTDNRNTAANAGSTMSSNVPAVMTQAASYLYLAYPMFVVFYVALQGFMSQSPGLFLVDLVMLSGLSFLFAGAVNMCVSSTIVSDTAETFKAITIRAAPVAAFHCLLILVAAYFNWNTGVVRFLEMTTSGQYIWFAIHHWVVPYWTPQAANNEKYNFGAVLVHVMIALHGIVVAPYPRSLIAKFSGLSTVVAACAVMYAGLIYLPRYQQLANY